jgi:hypothetical protein
MEETKVTTIETEILKETCISLETAPINKEQSQEENPLVTEAGKNNVFKKKNENSRKRRARKRRERQELENELTVTTDKAPPIIERIERPPVVEETVVPYQREEVQPIIYREKEQFEIKEVVQPLEQKVYKPEQVEERTLPSQTVPIVRADDTEALRKLQEMRLQHQPKVEREEPIKERVDKPPIIFEKQMKHVLEEIQPIIHKETIETHIIKETQPIFETIVEAPVITQEVRPPKQILSEGDIPAVLHVLQEESK